MCLLCAVIISANIIIYAQSKKFKNALTKKKDELNAISAASSGGDARSDAPAMSPARKEADRKQLVKKAAPPAEVEMTEAPAPVAPPSAQEEEATAVGAVVGAPADAPADASVEEAPAAEEEAAVEE